MRIRYHSLLLLLIALAVVGCKKISGDQLVALKLDQPPMVADWERALPRVVAVRGGNLHRLKKLADVDSDTVHTTTASCHHGASLPEPVEVDLRAFYTDKDLYLRLSWADATRDDHFMQWGFDGERWKNQGGLEDGIGLMWDAEGRFPQFSCSYACHIDDFGVSGSSFHAQNKMRLAVPGAWTDLWHWKAERTGHYGFADDRFLDQRGMHGDVPGELFRENSRARLTGASAFTPDDQPLYLTDGRSVEGAYLPPQSTAPGYLTELPTGGRADVKSHADYRRGVWTVVLKRSLQTGDPRDVIFVPGDEAGVSFGIAIMDHTLNQHFASPTLERLVLLAQQ